MKSITITKLVVSRYYNNLIQAYQLLDYTNKRGSIKKWFRSKDFSRDAYIMIYSIYNLLKKGGKNVSVRRSIGLSKILLQDFP